ncbi:MAG: polysaccharide deacetylase family protein, partial [Cyclobacteriaceae bacterium]|nr:polysaccharide deacetylase family protein [Cyclobacteriaceae bacterium]
MSIFWIFIGISSIFGSCTQDYTVRTDILKWKDGKKAAVSLTYDDGTLNQFRVALPIMEEFDMRGTFYINTGEIPG